MATTTKVLILGAGMAGLACGDVLRRARVDFRILEARDRVGGRLWSLRDMADGRAVEGGAMMIHGRDASVHAWVSEFGLGTRRVPAFRGGRILYEGRLRSVPSLILASPAHLRAAADIFWTLPRTLLRYEGPDMTLAEFLATQRASPLASRFVAAMYAGINAAEPEEVGVRGIAEEANASSFGTPWRNYLVPAGLDRIAARRAETFADRIQLGTRVERIEWSRGGVRIEASGPDGAEVHEASAAVITAPLGVLKAGDIAFDPPLPERKRRAIDALGYGDATKVLLRFNGAARRTTLGRSHYLVAEDGGFFFLPFARVPEAPPVVEGFLPGRWARTYAGRPAHDVVDGVIDAMAPMVPRFDLREHLRAARVVDWAADPWSKGAYSFPSVGGGLDARRDLAEPIEATLFFAGEATNYEGEHATIHGALDSGERAAREVLAALRDR